MPTPSDRSQPPRLLEREAFRLAVFARDGSRCVACPPGIGAGRPGRDGVAADGTVLDAHHLLNRRLWLEPDERGGYFVENGVSVCPEHHRAAEETRLAASELRGRAGITRVVVPRQLAADERYDTWGNVELPNGTRLRGPLFADEAAQKALAAGGALPLFTHFVKAPRIGHLSWSEGATDDDARVADLSALASGEVVVTEKLDGENVQLYTDYVHARSLGPMTHPSQSKVKAFHARIARDIPKHWRIGVENLAAVHTIRYDDLESLFPVTAVWDERNHRLAWDDVTEVAHLLGLPTAPVLYRGPFDEARIRACYVGQIGTHAQEGYVVSAAGSFPYGDAARRQAKFVGGAFRRALAATGGVHWATKPVEWNRRRADSPWVA